MKYLPFAALAAAAASSVFALIAKNRNKTANPSEQTKEMLPVSRVVMYQSGIGYVERCAQIASDKLILRIRPDQINDILKSLTIIDRGNGRPVSISLPVDKDTLDSLAQIPDQIKDGGVRSLLNAFRGANVKIKTKCLAYEGRIVGVDEADSSNHTSESTLSLLTSANVLHVITISEIRSVALYDQSLTDGLDKSLNISLNEGNWKQLELTIQLDSSEPREIALSYIVAMPTWKPAYRLILKDDDKAILQGWAVISNVTGADWNSISFSLVSGQPMSFTFDLYTPKFLERPDLSSLAEQKAAAPKVITSGYGAQAPGQIMAPMSAPGNMAMMGGAVPASDIINNPCFLRSNNKTAFLSIDEDRENTISDEDMAQSFTPQAETSQIGSFDEYRLASSLTLPDGNTALVNLIHHEIFAKDTRLIQITDSDFNNLYKGYRQTKSFKTIELQNDTDIALNAGPITLYRDSAVIGEGYLSHTDKNARAYITYANEGRLSVTIIDDLETDAVRLDSVGNGRIVFTVFLTFARTFQFESHIDHKITALLQIQSDPSAKPIQFPERFVKSENKYTIPVDINANSTQALTLSMQQSGEVVSKARLTDNRARLAIENALKEGRIPDKDRANFKQFLDDNERIEQIINKKNYLYERKCNIERDQKELTNNLSGLKDLDSDEAKELKTQLLKRHQACEQFLVDMTKELYSLDAQLEETELSLKTLFKTLKYQRPMDTE